MELNRKRFNIPKLKGKTIPDKLKLSIESAHAGIINDNNFFYTPKSLVFGCESLKKFYKPLQKAHYSHTLGYIFDANYEQLKTIDSIDKAKTQEDLVINVKKYLKSNEYSANGLGVLHSKALLYNKDKINSLYNQEDVGFVSIAGNTAAYCSICSKEAHLCEHKPGHYYNGEVCFNIVDILDIDHISFESCPADTKTRTTVMDSKAHENTVTIIEGNSMKLTIEEFKEYLKDIETVLKDFELSSYLSTYQRTAESADKSDFLFPKDQLGLLTTKLGVVLLTKALDKVEESEDLVTLRAIVGKEYNKLLGEDIDLETALASLEKDEETVEPKVTPTEDEKTDPVVEEKPKEELQTPVADSFSSLTMGALTETLQAMFEDYTGKISNTVSKLVNEIVDTKSNQYYSDRIEALQDKITMSKSESEKLTVEYKDSLLSQIVLLRNLDVESDYYKKLTTRSARELKLTLEDATMQPVVKAKEEVVATPVVEEVVLEPQPKDEVVELMTSEEVIVPELKTEVKDADTIVTGILSTLTSNVLSGSAYKELYTNTLSEHGRPVAKKLYKTLKDRNMI